MSERKGALALVLHSHMPYVEGFGTWPFGEEWLWEAVAGVYLPLLELLDGAPVTVGLTPVLCDQLEAMCGEPGERFLAYLRKVKAAIHAEDAAGLEQGGEPGLAAEVRRAATDYVRAEAAFERCERDLLRCFAGLDRVELWTSSATHAVLPLLATDAGIALQLATGVHSHARRFGGWSGGLWLPECAYEPGLERQLADHGVRAFCVDQTHALGHGSAEQLTPIATAAGPLAVPIDWATVELVWDDRAGYPVNAAYRDYHRRTIHDLRPWNNGGGALRPRRRARARPHSCARLRRARQAAAGWRRPALLRARHRAARPLVVRGHGLAGGRAGGGRGPGIGAGHGERGAGAGARCGAGAQASTWGSGKDMSTWDAPAVADLATGAREAELRTVAATATGRRASANGASRDSLARAARELLALQSSDWAFMATRDLAADYPRERVRAHVENLDTALQALKDSGPAPEPTLRELAPDLDLASLTTP